MTGVQTCALPISRAEVTGAHWDDYSVAAADGTATLSAAVPQPYGDVRAYQMWIAGEYRGATVTLAAEVSAQDVAGHAELSLFTITHTEARSRARPVFPAPPGRQPTAVRRDRRDSGKTITGSSDWTRYQITAQVPGRGMALRPGRLAVAGPPARDLPQAHGLARGQPQAHRPAAGIIGQDDQDAPGRGCAVRPRVEVRLSVRDADGGHGFPP